MTLDSQRILSLFALFTDLPDIELAKWSGLCVSASGKLMRMLRENTDVSKNMERLCNAAAALAYCDYTLLASGSGTEDVKVGDVSLKVSGDAIDAISTRDYMLSEISDLIEIPVGFVFRATGDAV